MEQFIATLPDKSCNNHPKGESDVKTLSRHHMQELYETYNFISSLK